MTTSDDQLMAQQDMISAKMRQALLRSMEDFRSLHHQTVQKHGEMFAGEAAMSCLTHFRRAKDLDRCMQVHQVVPAWPKPLIDLSCELGRVDYLPSLINQMEELGVSDLGSAMAVAGLNNQRGIIDYLWDQCPPDAQSRALVWAIIKDHVSLQEYLWNKGAQIEVTQEWDATSRNIFNLLEFGSPSQVSHWVSWDLLCKIESQLQENPTPRVSRGVSQSLVASKALAQAKMLHEEVSQSALTHSSRPFKKM